MTTWIRARDCEGHGCVEATAVGGGVRLRSSLRPDAVVVLDAGEWAVFMAGVRAGDFDQIQLEGATCNT